MNTLADNFDYLSLSDEQRRAVDEIRFRFNRLGYMLRTGLVREEDIFPFAPFGIGALMIWEKLKHTLRIPGGYSDDSTLWGTAAERSALPVGWPAAIHFEYLASRAQRYVLDHGEAEIGSIPRFDADLEALRAMRNRAQAARTSAA